MKTKLEIYRERCRADYEERMKNPQPIKWTRINLGDGPAHDYQKGAGNWTGD
jgi:hypothetical protein